MLKIIKKLNLYFIIKNKYSLYMLGVIYMLVRTAWITAKLSAFLLRENGMAVWRGDRTRIIVAEPIQPDQLTYNLFERAVCWALSLTLLCFEHVELDFQVKGGVETCRAFLEGVHRACDHERRGIGVCDVPDADRIQKFFYLFDKTTTSTRTPRVVTVYL